MIIIKIFKLEWLNIKIYFYNIKVFQNSFSRKILKKLTNFIIIVEKYWFSLALRLGEGGKYIVNGNFKVMTQRVIVDIGVTIEYSGRDSRVERLNTSRPIETDLILEVSMCN